MTLTGGYEQLRHSVMKVFKDVVGVESELIIQYRCEDWGGICVDVLKADVDCIKPVSYL